MLKRSLVSLPIALDAVLFGLILMSQAWWYVSAIPVLERWNQKVKASLSYTVELS